MTLTRAGINPAFVTSATVGKGTLGAWTQVNANAIEATVTPDVQVPTGSYPFTLHTMDGATYVRTPVVLASVADRWNQPELFNGPVNSVGWQDSPQAFVTTDGNGTETLYLALVYIPIRFDCVHGAQPPLTTNPLCNTIHGPYLPPDRPFMNIAAFVDGNGTIDETLPNLIQPGFTVPQAVKFGSTLYVFKFAQDGYPGYVGTTLTQPQALTNANDDGLSTLAGPFLFQQGNSVSLIYNLDQPVDSLGYCQGFPGDVGGETGNDGYMMENFDFSDPNVVLGQYQRVVPGSMYSNGAVNMATGVCPERILAPGHIPWGIPLLGTQGNPSVYVPATGQAVASWDEEGQGTGALRMAVLAPGQPFPGGTWNVVTADLPMLRPPPMQGGSQPEKSQPVLTSTEFCARNDLTIECTPYNGGDPALESSYGVTQTQLAGVGFAVAAQGQISAVGEPGPFRFQGRNCMSFVLAEQVDTLPANLNLKLAWVCE